ncbi:amino acid ABC transporter permease [Streptomyces shenzhenensis]
MTMPPPSGHRPAAARATGKTVHYGRTEVDDPHAPPLPRRHPGHWVTGAVVIVLIVLALKGFVTNDQLQWPVFRRYFFSRPILEGLAVTIELTVLAEAIAVVVGMILALLNESRNPSLRLAARAYVGFFRGLPLIVLLLVSFNFALFVPRISVFAWSWDTNALISGFTAAVIGLSLHEAAFAAEIMRAGLMSVSHGQVEAALSLGMRRTTAMRTIVVPQATRVIIPPIGNQLISLLKASALVAVIGGGDLLTRAQQIYGANFAVVPLLMVATVWYLILVLTASLGQHLLERKFAFDKDRNRTQRRPESPRGGSDAEGSA